MGMPSGGRPAPSPPPYSSPPTPRPSPPPPAAKLRIVRIEGMPDPVVQGLVAGGDEHFASSPGEFVIVHELVTVMSKFLIRAVRAEALDGAFEEIPPLLRLVQVKRGGFG